MKRPKTLTDDEKAVWDELAPHALEARTLTPATVSAFAMLCRCVVIERRLAASALGVAGPDHRGMLQRVEGLMARFRIVPDGKPVHVGEESKDEWSEFDNVVPMVKPA